MKRAVILHGTDGNPDAHWQSWLRGELEKSGYEVFAPELPNNHTPSLEVYDKFLRGSGWDFTDNLVVGHSSGATTVLNLLMADWFPHIKATVLAGTFLNEKLTKLTEWYDPGQFDKLFLDKYEPEKLQKKVDKFYFVHGSDDPYCDIDDAKELCTQVRGVFITIENGQHLNMKKLPQLEAQLQADNLL